MFSSSQSDWSFPSLMEMILLIGYTRPINYLTFTTLQLNTCCLQPVFTGKEGDNMISGTRRNRNSHLLGGLR